MPKETMTPRERWLAVLRREPPDRVPMDYWATAEASEKIKKHLGCASLDQVFARLHVDNPLTVGPRYIGPRLPEDTDVWGLRRKTVPYAGGAYDEVVSHPLAQFNSVGEIEKGYRWPSPDWYDYSELPGRVTGQEHRPIRGGGSEPFLTYKYLRGDEQAFVDLIENPEIVHYCMDRMYGLACENTRRIYEAIPGKVLVSYVAEDLGAQTDLLYSPEQIRTFFLPWMKKMVELVHGAGAYAFTHSDGAVRKILPDLIAIGVDVLNPIQWRCSGMEREGLKRDFGRQLVFHGGVDNQQTLAFGTVRDVREEVIHNLRVLGAGGGYMLAPCHNIQAVSPPENIVAMYETGYQHGWVG